MSQNNIYPISFSLFSPSATVATTNSLFGGIAGWQTTPIVGGLFTVGNIVGGSATMTMTGWSIKLQVAPGGVASMTFTVFKNNSPIGMPTITITGSATTGVWAGSASFSPTDIITVTALPSGSPTVSGSRYVNWCVKWTSSTSTFQMFSGINGNNTIATNTTLQLGPQWGGSATFALTDDTGEQSPMPVAGTIQNLYVYLSTDPTTGGVHPGETITVTVCRNPYSGSANTGRVTTTVSVAAGVSGASSDTTHSQHFNQGDEISFRVISSTNCATEQLLIGYEFVPDVPGYSIWLGETTPSGNLTLYHGIIGSTQTATETIAEIPMFAATASNLWQRASTTQGTNVNIPVSGSFAINCRKNAGATTLQTAVVNGQYANDTAHSVSFADGDLMNGQTITSGCGATCLSRWGMAFIAGQPATLSHLLALMGVGT